MVRTARTDAGVLLALLVIYVVWGSTFLAIRILVEHVPPLFAASLRFTIAGAILYGWCRLRGIPHPTSKEWRSLAVLGGLMFFLTYSALFWAEESIPSGVASVLAATLPVWTVLFEVVFKREPLNRRIIPAILLGFAGIIVLTYEPGRNTLRLLPCLAILGGEAAWALGSVLSRSLQLPKSKGITAGAEMLSGGILLLAVSAGAREISTFPNIPLAAGLALLYLIAAGSLLGFTAFVWLLGRMPASRVATHAYVNPVVALALGYGMGGEKLSLRTLVGAGMVLASVFLILGRGLARLSHDFSDA